ncbi:MAG: phosphoglycerate kinase [Candidatus Hydrothermarchaeales archaeon]
MKLPTLDNFDLAHKRVLLRLDINSPMDPVSNIILDDMRLRSHIPTLHDLEDSKVIIIAHQSRPGKKDFTPLEPHAKKLREIIKRQVKYVNDTYGDGAKTAIEKLKDGEVLVLENIRFCSDEVSKDVISQTPEEQGKIDLVRKLSSYTDFYVNDAFAVSHRSQPSIVGFPQVMPSCFGRLMEKEITVLTGVMESKEKPRVFCLGGIKADDSFKVIKHVLERGIADKILTSGVVANIFLAASGKEIGSQNSKFLKELGLDNFIPEAKGLMDKYEGKIEMPLDLAFQNNGSRVETTVEKIPDNRILDIGIETIIQYKSIIEDAKIIVANGPAGVFEMKEFSLGTEEMLNSIASSNGISVIGGGHLATLANSISASKGITHISTGGGACVSFLSGEKLPGIEAIRGVSRRGKK